MSHVVTELDVRRLGPGPQGRSTWRLLAPLVYESDLVGTISVPFGFVTDFASVPRLPLAFMVAGDHAHQAAVIHDWLYTTHAVDGKPITRAQADAVFQEAIKCSDPDAPAALMWLGVRVGGGGAWDAAGAEQPEHVAAAIDYAKLEAP